MLSQSIESLDLYYSYQISKLDFLKSNICQCSTYHRIKIFSFESSIFQCLSVLAVAGRERVGPEGAVCGRRRRLHQVLHAAIPDAFRR